jgi:hypothetical protein
MLTPRVSFVRVWSAVCGGRGNAAEVSVLEPVAVSLQGDDLGVVDEVVDHGGDGVVAEDLAPAAASCTYTAFSGTEHSPGTGTESPEYPCHRY